MLLLISYKLRILLQWFKCHIPFNPFYIGCCNFVIVKDLPLVNSQLIKCSHCQKLYVIKHLLQAVLPWDKELDKLYGDLDKGGNVV